MHKSEKGKLIEESPLSKWNYKRSSPIKQEGHQNNSKFQLAQYGVNHIKSDTGGMNMSLSGFRIRNERTQCQSSAAKEQFPKMMIDIPKQLSFQEQALKNQRGSKSVERVRQMKTKEPKNIEFICSKVYEYPTNAPQCQLTRQRHSSNVLTQSKHLQQNTATTKPPSTSLASYHNLMERLRRPSTQVSKIIQYSDDTVEQEQQQNKQQILLVRKLYHKSQQTAMPSALKLTRQHRILTTSQNHDPTQVFEAFEKKNKVMQPFLKPNLEKLTSFQRRKRAENKYADLIEYYNESGEMLPKLIAQKANFSMKRESKIQTDSHSRNLSVEDIHSVRIPTYRKSFCGQSIADINHYSQEAFIKADVNLRRPSYQISDIQLGATSKTLLNSEILSGLFFSNGIKSAQRNHRKKLIEQINSRL
ncbi:hypothetical protein FGO68_gene11461 [Halteria grandinella]|uniref:Uncharacterized protein n=1 Tax=Halteria grandinella TaxID=5974 RepID=A0A8J8T2T7_HALGN|nr:hypothetical protein FGO68_gene11461 [Halteria grandinella]